MTPLVFALSLTAGAQSLRYAEEQAPGIVHPAYTATMSEARLNELLFEALFTDAPDLSIEGELAASWQASDDGTALEVTLRDATWHDGKPVTAADVAFTVRALQDPRSLSTERGRVAFISAVEVVSPRVVRFTFTRPLLAPEAMLGFKILPEHRFSGDALQRSGAFRAQPIGSGPYRFVRFEDDGSVSLERVPGHRDQPSIPAITLREVPEKSYQAKLLLYNSLEALVRVLPRDLALLESQREIELYPYQTNSWWYLGLNQGSAALSDVRVRQAIAQIIDEQALLDPIGTGETLTGPYVPSSPYYNHAVEPWTPNPVEVDRLLQDAGYEKVAGDWRRDGSPLQLRLVAQRGVESVQEVVINLQAQLQRAGVGVQVDFLDPAAWRELVWTRGEYDLLVGQWSFDRNEDIREQFHSAGANNVVGYANPAVDTLLDRAQVTRDPAEKQSLLREVHRLVHDDAPMVFLFTLDSYSAVTAKADNVEIHPFYYFTWAADWSLR